MTKEELFQQAEVDLGANTPARIWFALQSLASMIAVDAKETESALRILDKIADEGMTRPEREGCTIAAAVLRLERVRTEEMRARLNLTTGA